MESFSSFSGMLHQLSAEIAKKKAQDMLEKKNKIQGTFNQMINSENTLLLQSFEKRSASWNDQLVTMLRKIVSIEKEMLECYKRTDDIISNVVQSVEEDAKKFEFLINEIASNSLKIDHSTSNLLQQETNELFDAFLNDFEATSDDIINEKTIQIVTLLAEIKRISASIN
jgi:hypothetical protein